MCVFSGEVDNPCDPADAEGQCQDTLGCDKTSASCVKCMDPDYVVDGVCLNGTAMHRLFIYCINNGYISAFNTVNYMI
jgi:hypothetical protein